VHHAVREDAEDLFGFETLDELSLFELLISVSGIGPRSALGLLGLADVSVLAGAIGRGDADYLTRVSGVGKKTAQKVVLELKDKVTGFAASEANTEDADVIDALIEMGYTRAHAREAIKTVSDSIQGVPARLKAALAQHTP
jgi:Holliday junction DNA helicase RuvA